MEKGPQGYNYNGHRHEKSGPKIHFGIHLSTSAAIFIHFSLGGHFPISVPLSGGDFCAGPVPKESFKVTLRAQRFKKIYLD